MFEKSSIEQKAGAINRVGADKTLLTHNSIKKYWLNIDADILAPLLFEMDSKEEDWTLVASPVVHKALKDFFETMKKIEGQHQEPVPDSVIKDHIEDLFFVLAYIPTSWCFRLLKWIDENRNSVLNKLLVFAFRPSASYLAMYENTGRISPVELLIDRIYTIKNLSLVAKVFSQERTIFIENFLDKMEKTHYGDKTQQ